LQPVAKTENKITKKYGEVPSVIFASVLSEDETEVTVFALNTDKNNSSITTIDLSGVGKTQMTLRTELCGNNLSATNTLENPSAVEPKSAELVQGEGSVYEVELKKASWNVLRFKIA
jgi:alpha-N-arabinofuranosidase